MSSNGRFVSEECAISACAVCTVGRRSGRRGVRSRPVDVRDARRAGPTTPPLLPKVDKHSIRMLVASFYCNVREDPMLGPEFERSIDARDTDWEEDLRALEILWSSVLLAGRRHQAPLVASSHGSGPRTGDVRALVDDISPYLRRDLRKANRRSNLRPCRANCARPGLSQGQGARAVLTVAGTELHYFPAYQGAVSAREAARAIRLRTFDTCHLPPRAVRMPRLSSASAMPR